MRNTERLLLGLTGCKCGGKGVKRGVFCVLCEVSKMCLEQLTVMMHIAIASRQNGLSKIQKV